MPRWIGRLPGSEAAAGGTHSALPYARHTLPIFLFPLLGCGVNGTQFHAMT